MRTRPDRWVAAPLRRAKNTWRLDSARRAPRSRVNAFELDLLGGCDRPLARCGGLTPPPLLSQVRPNLVHSTLGEADFQAGGYSTWLSSRDVHERGLAFFPTPKHGRRRPHAYTSPSRTRAACSRKSTRRLTRAPPDHSTSPLVSHVLGRPMALRRNQSSHPAPSAHPRATPATRPRPSHRRTGRG